MSVYDIVQPYRPRLNCPAFHICHRSLTRHGHLLPAAALPWVEGGVQVGAIEPSVSVVVQLAVQGDEPPAGTVVHQLVLRLVGYPREHRSLLVLLRTSLSLLIPHPGEASLGGMPAPAYDALTTARPSLHAAVERVGCRSAERRAKRIRTERAQSRLPKISRSYDGAILSAGGRVLA